MVDINTFVDLWNSSLSPHGNVLASTAHPPLWDLEVFAGLLVDTHVLFHGGAFSSEYGLEHALDEDERDNIMNHFEAVWNVLFQQLGPARREALLDDDEIFTALRDTLRKHGLSNPRTGAAPCIQHCGPSHCNHTPDWPLTPVLEADAECAMDDMKRARQSGLCTVQELRTVFGEILIDIPETFAYCVKGEEAYDAVKRAVAEASKGGNARRLSWRMKAMVLERLYVH